MSRCWLGGVSSHSAEGPLAGVGWGVLAAEGPLAGVGWGVLTAEGPLSGVGVGWGVLTAESPLAGVCRVYSAAKMNCLYLYECMRYMYPVGMMCLRYICR